MKHAYLHFYTRFALVFSTLVKYQFYTLVWWGYHLKNHCIMFPPLGIKSQPTGVAEWIAHPIDMSEVCGLGTAWPVLTLRIHFAQGTSNAGDGASTLALKTYRWSKLKLETENTSGSAKWWLITAFFFKTCAVTIRSPGIILITV